MLLRSRCSSVLCTGGREPARLRTGRDACWEPALLYRSIALMLMILMVPALGARAVLAEGTDLMHEGLALINQTKFADARRCFERLVKQSPNNVQAHYCLAVCFHKESNYPAAVREYSWVCKNTTQPDLVRRSKKGWAACYEANKTMGPATASSFTMSGPSWGGGGDEGAAPSLAEMAPDASSAPAAAVGAPGAQSMGSYANRARGAVNSEAMSEPALASEPVSTSTPSSHGPPSPTMDSNGVYVNAGGMPKVVDVYTDWCGWCKKFEPNFEKARQKFAGRIDFQRINAEQPGNRAFCKQYHVDGYPTFVLLDSSGKAVDIIRGCPDSYDDFEQSIKAAFPNN